MSLSLLCATSGTTPGAALGRCGAVQCRTRAVSAPLSNASSVGLQGMLSFISTTQENKKIGRIMTSIIDCEHYLWRGQLCLLMFGQKALNPRGLKATLIPTQTGLVTGSLYSAEVFIIENESNLISGIVPTSFSCSSLRGAQGQAGCTPCRHVLGSPQHWCFLHELYLPLLQGNKLLCKSLLCTAQT